MTKRVEQSDDEATSFVVFQLDYLLEELRTLKKIARSFLDASQGCDSMFERAIASLTSIAEAKRFDRAENWTIEPPGIRTKIAKRYTGKDNNPPVVGEVTWKWTLRPVECRSRSLLKIAGTASVMCRILAPTLEHNIDGKERSLATWTFDVGVHDSPGSHFHIQLKGDGKDGYLPPNLPVPRLPSILVTPMAVLDFFLGELFQDAWISCVTAAAQKEDHWRSSQFGTLEQLLNWKIKSMKKGAGSVWSSLKIAKPKGADKLFAEVR